MNVRGAVDEPNTGGCTCGIISHHSRVEECQRLIRTVLVFGATRETAHVVIPAQVFDFEVTGGQDLVLVHVSHNTTIVAVEPGDFGLRKSCRSTQEHCVLALFVDVSARPHEDGGG